MAEKKCLLVSMATKEQDKGQWKTKVHLLKCWQKNQTVKVQVSLPKEPMQQLTASESIKSLLNCLLLLRLSNLQRGLGFWFFYILVRNELINKWLLCKDLVRDLLETSRILTDITTFQETTISHFSCLSWCWGNTSTRVNIVCSPLWVTQRYSSCNRGCRL